MMDPDTKKNSWAKIGVSVISSKINGRASRFKDGKSPYKIYYCKQNSNIASYVLDDTLLNQAKTQYGLNAIGKEDPTIQIPLSVIKKLIAESDQFSDREERILEAKNSGDKAEDDCE